MKVVCDLSVTSAAAHGGGGNSAPWDAAWESPISQTPAALVMDFAAGKYGADGTQGTIDSVLTVARPTAATRTDATGALELVAADQPRIDHDPVSLAPRGLLLEPARTNLIVQSGTPAAQSITVSAVQYVLSFYGSGSVDLTNAHVATVAGSGTYPVRTSVTFTPAAGTLDLAFTGDVFAPQLEEAGVASAYIPTAASATLREDDVPTTALGGWFSGTGGTLVLSGSLEDAAANDRILEIDDGNTTTRMSILWNTVLSKPQFQVWDAGTLQAAIAPPGNSVALGEHFRVAIGWAANDFAISLNGSALATDTLGNLPSGLATMRIGRSIWGAQGITVCEGITYYPARLSDAEIQALSS